MFCVTKHFLAPSIYAAKRVERVWKRVCQVSEQHQRSRSPARDRVIASSYQVGYFCMYQKRQKRKREKHASDQRVRNQAHENHEQSIEFKSEKDDKHVVQAQVTKSSKILHHRRQMMDFYLFFYFVRSEVRSSGHSSDRSLPLGGGFPLGRSLSHRGVEDVEQHPDFSWSHFLAASCASAGRWHGCECVP